MGLLLPTGGSLPRLLHALGQQVVGQEGVEGRVPVVLVSVRGAPHPAPQPRAVAAAGQKTVTDRLAV